MWITDRTKTAVITPRPIRIAYLVPCPPSHDLLDALFDEAMSRWGGRRTPIVQTDGASISPDFWNLLDLWDADIIYSYVDLNENLHACLSRRLAPSEVIIHPAGSRDLRPRLRTNVSLLTSASVLPTFARWHTWRAQQMPRVLDKERNVDLPRDLDDSFGFASNSLNDFTLLPHALRISFRPPGDRRRAPRFGSAEEVTYVETRAELETMLAESGGLLCLAEMSDMFVPCLSAFSGYRMSWDEHLSIVVGDEVSDRLLFWNGIHRYRSLTRPGNFQLLRLSPGRFVNGVPTWVSRLCSGQRNWRHFHGNSAPQTIIRSCSADEVLLKGIAEQIGATGMNMSSAISHNSNNADLFECLRGYRRASPRGERQGIFISEWHTPTPKTEGHVRFERDQFEVPLVSPFHLKEASSEPTTAGAWAIDLRIDRNEDHSAYDERHRWMFPRRLRLEGAVRIQNYGHDHLTLPPLARPTEAGDLAIWDSRDWRRPIVSMPSDFGAFVEALGRHHPGTPKEARSHHGLGLVYRFNPVTVSDKGRDLLGVFQLFRSLAEALIFLTNPYWLSIVQKLCPTEPEDNPERVKELAGELRQAIEQGGESLDFNRVAKRVMEKTAAWMYADSKHNASISYESLIASLPRELRKNEWRNELERSVQYLRDRTFLRQGYSWRCEVCQHPNWVHLEDVAPILHCEICRTEESSPVCGNNNVHFRLNPFVAAAFSSSSSQGSVAWALNRLANRASWSFMFTPALDIYKPGERDRFTDVDVLASVDGEVFLLEVKRGFAGVNEGEVERLVELASALRPDFAGFAVKRPRAECSLDAAAQQRIERELASRDVRFLLWSSDDRDPWGFPIDIPIAFGQTMEWRAW